MRIISGRYRGKAIHPPAGLRARPTTDFAREALFNILENRFDLGALHVLDLFSGTGCISYEFASRGAVSVTAVEADPCHVRFIQRTAKELGFDMMQVWKADVFRYLKRPPPRPFDLVFADPPYALNNIISLPGLVLENGFLDKEGWMVLEHGKDIQFRSHPLCFDERTYGSVHFSFFRMAQGQEVV